MKQTSTNSSVAFKKCLVLILTVLGFSFNQFVLVVMKKKVYPAVLRNGLKSLLVCMACWLMPFVAKADTPIPTSIVSSYDPVLRKLTMTVNWIWGSTDNSKIVSAAVFADLNGDGIVPTFLDNPATYNSGGNAFPAGLSAKDEFLGQLAISTIEGSASSGTYTDNTDNGIAATIGNFGTSDPRVLFPYGTTTVNSVGLSGSFTMTFTNLNVAPTKICVVMYDVHTDKLTSLSGNHSARSANPDHNGDNSVEDGNSNGRVSCTGLASLSCAINKTESACQSQAAINASYAAWLASVTASGCNGVLTNNSTGAPSATGGSKTVTFTYTQSGCSNQAAVTTCTATFTVPTCPNSIGDRVWLDADGNGIQDASETGGITGVTVQLRNSANTVIATQNTNATGNYLFTGLAAGTYTVVFPVSISGAVVTTANVGTNDDIDSDPSQATGITGNIVLAAGQGIVNVDAGYCPITLQIGNRVFNDLNNNGIDNTEAGISSATVNLYKDDNNDNVADGASIATVTTNSTGNYTFANLSPGNYIVGVVTPAGFVSSAINGGDPDNNTDLDDNGQVTVGIETRGLAITLISGTEPNGDVNNTYDFGFYTPPPPLTLGNKVFFDLNRSGMYEATDSVASGIIVRLYADANNDNIPDGAFIQAASTNGLGEYSFTNLAAGNYIVGAVIPLVHAITVINGGDPDNNIDNDNNAINNVSGEARGNSISLASGTEPTAGNTNNTYDIGFYNPTLPPNGGQNCFAGTNPVVYAKSFWNVNANSQTVTLRVTFSKKFVDNTYGTGAIGWPNGHTFGNLTGSDHLQWSIRDANGVEKLVFKQDYISASASFPSGYGCLGFGGDGGTPTVGLATDVLSFRTSIAANFNDFGYVLTTNSPATDTFYTPNPAQPNWMYDVWYEVTVKASIFGAPGFGFVNVASVHASPSKTGNNTEIITNTPCVSSIGDRVWYDTDRDGIQDAGENGIRGVTVKLRNAANTVIATQVTNTTGNYLFTGLNAGTYTVEFPATVYGYILSPAYVGTNRHIDSDPSVSTGITPSIVLGTADDIRTIDAGYAPDCACTNSTGNLLVNANFENGTTGWSWSGGTLTTGTGYVACGAANGFNNWSAGTSRVWQDVTASAGATVSFSAFAGTHAPGIACSPKLSLIFLNSANAVISQIDVTVTRVVGDYNDQLEQYSITAVAPAGTTKVRVQSSITCNTMKLDAFCLTVSPTGSIGDFVWEDLNRNGLQEANEPGIGGVTVTLSGTSSATTTTAANGSYSFNNLAAGTYNVTFATPVAPGNTFLPTTSNVGANDAIDSDPVGGVVSNIVLAAGQVNNTVDAGFYRLLNLSGNVWHDVNGMLDSLVNNTRGDSAAVIPTGLKMILVDANTSLVVRTTLVQGNGAFNFPNILPGTYILVLKVESANIADPSPFASLPDGWRNTGEKLGLNLAKVPPLHDGVINGKLTVTVSTVSVTNANFGINFGGDFPIN